MKTTQRARWKLQKRLKRQARKDRGHPTAAERRRARGERREMASLRERRLPLFFSRVMGGPSVVDFLDVREVHG